MNQYFADFYYNWKNKPEGIVGDSLSNVYEKYMTLFVIFNNLYNQIPNKLVLNGVAVPDKICDNKAATEFVVKYLGGSELLAELTANDLDNDINAIIDLIDEEVFHIKTSLAQAF